jgi:hypothetical protein
MLAMGFALSMDGAVEKSAAAVDELNAAASPKSQQER